MTVQQRIKEVAKHFTGCHYCFANWAQLNTILDDIEEGKPTICYILPPSGTIRVDRGSTCFTDMPKTLIAFLTDTKLDFDGEENDEKIEQMKHLAMMFVRALNDSGYFQTIDEENINYSVPYDTADDNVTGIILTLPIQEQWRIMCNMPDDFGYVEKLEDVETETNE